MNAPHFLDSRYFPNITPGAFYSPHDLAVHLPGQQMDAARIRDEVYRHEWTLQHLPILIHEYQHSVDHLGTVAGRRLLDTLVAGLVGLSKKLQGDISGLPELVAYHDHQRLFYRKAYFTEILPGYRPKGPGRPKWSWVVSLGVV